MQHIISRERASDAQTTKLTRAFLACGVVAGPLFTIVGLIQAYTRPGFNLTRNALSVLENGNLAAGDFCTILRLMRYTLRRRFLCLAVGEDIF